MSEAPPASRPVSQIIDEVILFLIRSQAFLRIINKSLPESSENGVHECGTLRDSL